MRHLTFRGLSRASRSDARLRCSRFLLIIKVKLQVDVGAHASFMRTFCIVKHHVIHLNARIKIGCAPVKRLDDHFLIIKIRQRNRLP